jgi:polyisoprenyl-phosphate glycosyltransferase
MSETASALSYTQAETDNMNTKRTLSILTPCYCEEQNIAECYHAVRKVMEGQLPQYDYEHLFIDNCSTDRTVAILKELAKSDPRVKIIVNARNFGAIRSSYYGILQTTGDAMIPILADLQTPPEMIVEFVKKWEAGNVMMVLAVYTQRKEPFPLKQLRRAFYSIMNRFSHIDQIQNSYGFGLYDRKVVNILRSLNETNPYFRGLIAEIGFEKVFVEYEEPPRKHSKSRWNFYDLFELAMLGLTGYSKVPLRLMTFVGICVSAVSLLCGIAYFFLKLLFWNYFPMGTVPLLIAVLFLSSVQIAAIGLLGEYIGMILQYTRQFPLVIEKERINF